MIGTILKSLGLTYIISVTLSIILAMIIYHPDPNGYDGSHAIVLIVVACFYMNFFMGLSALTALLNLKQQVRDDILSRKVSFFL